MSAPTKKGHDDHHMPLMGLFAALLALTAAEVALFEIWHRTAVSGEPFIPKVAMVLILILVLTLPKAAIVLVYFMHIKYEKFIVVFLALIPILFAGIAVLPTLTDLVTLRDRSYTHVEGLSEYKAVRHDDAGHGAEAGHEGHDHATPGAH
jgi:hypothetical protein